jgi:hypothetical protein
MFPTRKPHMPNLHFLISLVHAIVDNKEPGEKLSQGVTHTLKKGDLTGQSI